MKKILLSITFAVVVLSLSGCVTRFVDFTIISSKNVELSSFPQLERLSTRVSGKDSVHWIIIIPLGVPNAKEALDRAIESVPGAVALVDGVIYQKFWWIPYIYGKQSYIVEGTPLVDPKLAMSDLPGQYLVTTVDKDGMPKQTESITKEDYDQLISNL